MIRSFKHKGLEKFFYTGVSGGIQAEHKQKIKNILTVLNTINRDYGLEPLNKPFYRLHKLKDSMKNLWAVIVQANWRITFEYDEETADVYIVNYQDYH